MTRGKRGPGRDGQLLRRASRRIGFQTGVLVLAAFCLCGATLLLVVFHFQNNATTAALRSAVASADDISDPPDGTWLVIRSADGRTAASPGAPRFMPFEPALRAVTPARPSKFSDVRSNHVGYRVLTVARNGRVLQAALSLAPQHAERTRLLQALAFAGAMAIVAAGVLGALSGRRSVRPLADALARQRAFVADASHELRTPLTHLITRAQLLERSLEKAERTEARVASRRLVADGRRLAETLEDLLLAAQPAERSDWNLVRLDEVAAGGATAIAERAASAGVSITVGPAAEPSDCPRVHAPRTALDRAVLALLDNAIRHTPRGGKICLAVSARHRWALLTVTDTGPGIAPGERDRLFDRFAHGEATHGSPRRFGLGLALVADTAERLGGELTFSGEPGEGTTMAIRLPRAR